MDGTTVEPKVGVVYVDKSHGDRFVIEALPTDERVAELENGQWYELDGPDGLLAKLTDRRVVEALRPGLLEMQVTAVHVTTVSRADSWRAAGFEDAYREGLDWLGRLTAEYGVPLHSSLSVARAVA